MNRHDSSSDSSDNGEVSCTSAKTLNFSYLILDSHALHHQFDYICHEGEKRAEKIETMLLYHNVLQVIPLNIVRFTNLRVLNVSNNRLTELPEAITKFPLTTLVAKNNLIENSGIPKSLANLNQLRTFNMSGNRLDVFPHQLLDVPSIKYLYLGSNQIQELPRKICVMQQLKILYLGGNRLTELPDCAGSISKLD